MSKGWQQPGMRGRAWRKKRAALLLANAATNGGRCQLQLPGCTGQAEEVHHVLGIQATGHDSRYLQCACRACNLAVGDPLKQPNPPPRPLSQWE